MVKEGIFHADVTILRVIDNRAIIGGVITSAPAGTSVVIGKEVCMVAVDDGNGKGVDQISFIYSGDTELDTGNNEWPLPDADSSTCSFDNPLNEFYGVIQVRVDTWPPLPS